MEGEFLSSDGSPRPPRSLGGLGNSQHQQQQQQEDELSLNFHQTVAAAAYEPPPTTHPGADGGLALADGMEV